MQAAPLFPSPADTRLQAIYDLLLGRYQRPAPGEPWDPLTQFCFSLLSARTKDEETHVVVRELQARFAGWEGVRDAPVEEIQRTIAAVTFAEVKAPRLKLALQQITARYGTLTLDFLAKYRTEKIREWLEGFEGVGPQVSAAVVNGSALGRRALCVDTHVLRVTQRLRLTPRADAAITEERLMRLVPAVWDAAMLREFQTLIKTHGQVMCTFAAPRCEGCPLLAICPTGQGHMGNEGLAGAGL